MATTGVVAIHSNEIHDKHAAFGSDLSTYTESLRSSVLQGVTENDCKYHSYRTLSNYLVSEDDQEQDRLELQHETCPHQPEEGTVPSPRQMRGRQLGAGPGHRYRHRSLAD